MHLGEISFCDKIGFNIKSDEFKKKILSDLESKYNFKVIQKHYERFNDNTPNILQNNPHLVSLRTNGNPYLLYLTKYNYTNQCIFIDKKIQHGYFYPRMIISRFWFDDELFKNTLFDGEMVKDQNGNWLFLINDMMADSGKTVESHNLVRRINRVYDILQSQFTADELDICNFQVKRYFHYHEFSEMVGSFAKSLPYSCRGMYFKPLFLKFKDILHNFDESLIKKVVRTKYKGVSTFLLQEDVAKLGGGGDQLPLPPPITKTTIQPQEQQVAQDKIENASKSQVLFVVKTSQPDIYELYDPILCKPLGVACVNNLKASKLLRELFVNATPTEKKRMECEWSEKFGKWVPLRVAQSL